MTYSFLNLKPLRITVDEDGDTHAIYKLPQSVRWEFRFFHMEPELSWQEEHWVDTIRVCISTLDHPFTLPATIIVPLDNEGKESPFSSIVLHGVSSIAAAMKRLGFEADFMLN